ncbi:MAG: 1-deoxy-D-xylulose-5-phosphate reductoisomerase, partial [Eubacteriales bacterium]|nr:1-deoxy-D-xylulose-5-phosphate reductoisomerase [Eubacteriales bacterium]
MTKCISLLGSTGSIGQQTLAVCSFLNIPVKAMTAGKNRELLVQQSIQFQPQMISIASEADVRWLRNHLKDVCPGTT